MTIGKIMKSKVKYKIKNINGAFGYFWNNEIVISPKLSKRSIPSFQFVLTHETFHKYLSDNNIKVTYEELRADLLSLFTCKDSELSLLERQFKKLLVRRFGAKPNITDIINLNIKEFLK